jgi:hypothetical protein
MIQIAVLATAACLLLSACGQNGPTGGNDTTPPVSGGPSLSNPPSPPDLSPSPSATTKPGVPGSPPAGVARTLVGTVTAGVEANCVLLDNFLLLGGPRDVLRPGKRVSVTGRVQTSVMTTCQQGTPFLVESAKPL